MKNDTSQAYAEVYDIINHFNKELYIKIPQNFINMIYKNRDKNYNVNIDYNKSINDQEILRETRVILSLIYRDYICSPEQKAKLIQEDKEELIRYEKELREKYNPDDIFKKREEATEHKQEIQENNYPVEVKKKTFFEKVLEKVRSLFIRDR